MSSTVPQKHLKENPTLLWYSYSYRFRDVKMSAYTHERSDPSTDALYSIILIDEWILFEFCFDVCDIRSLRMKLTYAPWCHNVIADVSFTR